MHADYRAKPWVALYDRVDGVDFKPQANDALDMFRNALKRAPERAFIHYFTKTFTLSQVDQLSNALAVQFSRFGVGHGDRVALFCQNNPQFILTVLATWKLGAIVVPINPMLRQRELTYILNDSGARILVTLESLYATVVSDVVDDTVLETVITTSELDYLDAEVPPLLMESVRTSFAGVPDLVTLIVDAEGEYPARTIIKGADVALLPYTSGTTGPPKGAMNTHANVVFNSEGLVHWQAIDADDVIMTMAPLFHITGLIVQMTVAFVCPSALVLSHRFDPNTTAHLIEHHRATLAIAAITAYIALMNTKGVTAQQLATLRLVISGGAPIAPAHIAAFKERFGHKLISAYGLTESTAPTHVTPATRASAVDEKSNTLSIGIPFYGVEVDVVDDSGHSVAYGEVGELVIAGPMVVPGYWNKPDETAHAFRDGRMFTGDVGFMDAAGWFYLVDRKKDMIVASGYKVWPREVEDVLYLHEAVREAAVVGVADEYRGETVKAFVSLKPESCVTEQALIAHCGELLAAYKRPHQIAFLDELPKTASGKILRRALRDP